jgi:molecular chaperone GrpE
MSEHAENEGGEERVVITDRRLIDPETGQVRAAELGELGDDQPGRHAAADEPIGADPAAEFKAQLDERTADLQRLQAEYANYRKRVERDRELNASNAKGQIVNELLGVLDDVERAAAHGDLTGAFKSVSEKLVAVLQAAGLEPFGHDGEAFDPTVHEAVQHNTSANVDGPTVTAVLRRGYRFGERVLRPALVAVTDHEPAGAE